MTDKVRVLTLIAGLAIGEPLGGAERFGVELACSLDRAEFEPIVCAFWRRRTPSEQYWAEYLAKQNVKVFFAAEWLGKFSLLQYIKGVRNIASYCQDKPIQVIHSHFQVGSISALILKNRLKAKAVVRTAHLSPDREWGSSFTGAVCRRIFTRWVFPIFFDAEVGVSAAVVSSLNQRLATRIRGRKALLIYNAVRLHRFNRARGNPEKRLEFGLSLDDLVVGSVGRLTEQKGYSFLIDAMPTVVAHLPNTKLIIIGDGELEFQLRKQVEKLGLSEMVIFAGSRQDVESLYGIMDLFVLPSLWEGLPTVALESMASGVPVVATDVTGTRELIQHGCTGWLVRSKDSMDLADKIVYALSHPLKRAEVAQRAIETVVPQYSMEHIASQYQALYRHLLGLSTAS